MLSALLAARVGCPPLIEDKCVGFSQEQFLDVNFICARAAVQSGGRYDVNFSNKPDY